MNYSEEIIGLYDAIQAFLDKNGIGSYKDEAHMRSALAGHLAESGFDVEEEKEIDMGNDETLRPDIVANIGDYKIPMELKYNNTSIDEYVEDGEKCERYVNELDYVRTAYCIFVSSINHEDYGKWENSIGDKRYHYMFKTYS